DLAVDQSGDQGAEQVVLGLDALDRQVVQAALLRLLAAVAVLDYGDRAQQGLAAQAGQPVGFGVAGAGDEGGGTQLATGEGVAEDGLASSVTVHPAPPAARR